MTPVPCAAHHGSSASAAARSIALNGGCRLSTCWIGSQRSSSSTSKLETPAQRTLPCATRSAITPHDSSTGVPVLPSGQWNW